ncbi:hypothetical protein F3087_33810 [Nocardia colli]|uniref:Uncharacterized protein n=1 Tax=Nocardia colli TaxID=2545717 RepID=A0A5N0E6I9_9NOCA|nr:hypothetical protein [Nocardia colli]KAA8884566.1 hypothetical protein F3087_33810 [Nocardia colli]
MAAQHKRPRPGSASDEMLKLHRRTMVLDGRVYTVVTLRPGSDFRFSTNRFHDTWHVLSDWRGARVLARLMWGLAYQRRPGTIVVIDPAHLDSNPFDGAPSDPIVLVPSELTVFTRAAATALRRRLPLRDRPAGTVRWQTFGLNHAVAELEAWRAKDFGERSTDYTPPPTGWLRIDRIGGLITIFGAADQLREMAQSLATLGTYAYCGMDYHYLDYPENNGEVQIFRHYRSRVTTARRARTNLLGSTHRGPITAETEHAIWSQAAAMRRNRLPRLAEPAPN